MPGPVRLNGKDPESLNSSGNNKFYLYLEIATNTHNTSQFNMSKARAATDQVVKLIVGAGQASPSPPVGPALGSKGVKSMDFCKV